MQLDEATKRLSFNHKVTVDRLLSCLGGQVRAVHGDSTACAVRVTDLVDLDPSGALMFASGNHLADIGKNLGGSAAIILTDVLPDGAHPGLSAAALLVVDNPRLCFIRAARTFIGSSKIPDIHHTAVIAVGARIESNVHIAAYAVVDNAVVGAGSVVESHCVIDDAVQIGKRVLVQAGSVLGGPGFGFERNEQSELERFPQLGTLLVEDDVEIGSGCRINRAALGETRLGAGTKIDNLVYIAHNVTVGRHCLICGGSSLCGGVRIGDGVFIGAGATIRQQINVGDGALIGMGAVVVQDVQPGQTVAGVPASPIES